jgi:hypothetical protein
MADLYVLLKVFITKLKRRRLASVDNWGNPQDVVQLKDLIDVALQCIREGG